MIYRLIPPKWLSAPVLEGEFTDAEIRRHNSAGYNVYYYPNHPSDYQPGSHVSGRDIDVFEWLFVDCDLKDKKYASKEAFYESVASSAVLPTKLVDSGNGVHAYWRVTGLTAKSYLRLQRRLMHLFNTDEATTMLCQLLRVPGTVNTKVRENPLNCELLYETDKVYSAEEFDKLLPPITLEDEEWCNRHYDSTFNQEKVEIDEKLPARFGKFLSDNAEAKELFSTPQDDRSKADFRLAHLMFADGFTRVEALSVLVNTVKAVERAPVHRASYAQNIVDKIWTYELGDRDVSILSRSVKEILSRPRRTVEGTRFACHPAVDNTVHGFRLGQVMGLVGGSGIGKTAISLNMFFWFAERNPDYDHLFVPLEQPDEEVARHWETISGSDSPLHDKVHILSNYDEEGNFRRLSFDDIKDYIAVLEKKTSRKIGCVVIDHIGALKKEDRDGENQGIVDICHAMKAFAVQTKTFLIMQSQSSREKAGIGDVELNKDAAYGTIYFEAYCDYLVTIWQPLKRCYMEPDCPTVAAYKFCKIREKKVRLDVIKEDVLYYLFFDTDIERLRAMTQDEETAFNFYLPKATNKRKSDRKTDLLTYTSVKFSAT